MADEVIIAGGGIAGLTLALTLHQIGVRSVILEAAGEMKPLGVGINLQPNAVRELFDLGVTVEALDAVGISVREWALVGLNGREVYSEPRGSDAGYHWPQFAVHRGAFQMLLHALVEERLGKDAVLTGHRVERYEIGEGHIIVRSRDRNGSPNRRTGRLLVGADGIHSAVRWQMYPGQPKIHWGGAIMWRGTVRTKPLRTGASFVGLGTHKHRMVIYPISKPDRSGMALVNWIAEMTVETAGDWPEGRWFRPVEVADFVHHFQDFRYDWLDVPATLEAADCAYENPMIDRDPIPSWVDGPVALMGDAAHAMYPTGSNGASQAIIDARVIGAKMLAHGVNEDALAAYNAELCGPVSDLVLRNRGAGPFGLLNLVDERCGGVFEDINDVISERERSAFMQRYKSAAGFEKDRLNTAPRRIPDGARVS